MENNQKEIKNYWNILKEELGKNKRVFFLLFLFTIIFALVFLWTAPASASVTERLARVAPFVVPFIIFIIFIILAIPTAVASRKRYENSIVGKNPWEIAEIGFRQYAKVLPIMFIAFVILDFLFLWLVPVSGNRMEMRFYGMIGSAPLFAVAFILFLALASLFKRKSPKAIALGYTCLVSLSVFILIYIIYSLWARLNGGFEVIFVGLFLIRGIMDIYKVSKHVANIKRDSELQKEIIKIKEEKK